ncbi:hypothetical protein [Nocardioides limicola]|nr:hypothetical protein [Nocardioides sp. DJM-14]
MSADLTLLAAESTHVSPITVGAIVLIAFVIAIIGLLLFAGGREHS